MSNLEPYTTSDTAFAAYLYCNSHKVVGMRQDPNNSKRWVFAFVKEENSEDLSNDYYAKRALVDPMQYYHAQKEMYKILNKYLNKDK